MVREKTVDWPATMPGRDDIMDLAGRRRWDRLFSGRVSCVGHRRHWGLLFGLALLLGGTWAGCDGEMNGRLGEQGPYRLVRFVETQGKGNIAMLSESEEGRILVSRSGLAAWSEGRIWLLGRRNLLGLLHGRAVMGDGLREGAAGLVHAGTHVLVSCPGQGRVDVFDDATLALVQSVETCAGASQMAASPSGRTVFVRCEAGLALLAGWVPSNERAGGSILLLSQVDQLLALSGGGYFVWSYPGLPAVKDWAIMDPEGRSLIGVGRRVHSESDLAVQGDSSFSVTLELVQLSFGLDLTEVTAVRGSLKVRQLARTCLGNAAWDPTKSRLLVPLPNTGDVLAVGHACLSQDGDESMVRSACGLVSSLGGKPGAVLPPGADAQGRQPLVWDRRAQILWFLDDTSPHAFFEFGNQDL